MSSTPARLELLGALLTAALLTTGCASSYVSTWADPDPPASLHLSGKPVAVVLLDPSEARRRAGETLVANEVTAMGARGVPGYTLLRVDDLEDRSQAQAALEQAGVAGVLVLRPVDEQQQTRYVPGRAYYAGSPYESLWGYWEFGPPTTIVEPGYYETDQVVFIEALYYSVPDDRLLWGGVSRATSAERLDRTIHALAKDTGREMRKAGLLGD